MAFLIEVEKILKKFVWKQKSIVTAVMRDRCLAQELLHAVGVAKKRKGKRVLKK